MFDIKKLKEDKDINIYSKKQEIQAISITFFKGVTFIYLLAPACVYRQTTPSG